MAEPEIVTTCDGRPCITGIAYVEHLTPGVRKWVRENCTVEPNWDVYFLPVGENGVPECRVEADDG